MLINNIRSSIVNAHGTRLMPGINSVDPAAWRESRKHPHVLTLIDIGEIVEESDLEEASIMTKEQDQAADENALVEMKIPQAKALVEQTVDLNLLEKWKLSEKRNQVISALNKQIDLLKAPAEERDRSAPRQVQADKPMIEINVPNPMDRE